MAKLDSTFTSQEGDVWMPAQTLAAGKHTLVKRSRMGGGSKRKETDLHLQTEVGAQICSGEGKASFQAPQGKVDLTAPHIKAAQGILFSAPLEGTKLGVGIDRRIEHCTSASKDSLQISYDVLVDDHARPREAILEGPVHFEGPVEAEGVEKGALQTLVPVDVQVIREAHTQSYDEQCYLGPLPQALIAIGTTLATGGFGATTTTVANNLYGDRPLLSGRDVKNIASNAATAALTAGILGATGYAAPTAGASQSVEIGARLHRMGAAVAANTLVDGVQGRFRLGETLVNQGVSTLQSFAAHEIFKSLLIVQVEKMSILHYLCLIGARSFLMMPFFKEREHAHKKRI